MKILLIPAMRLMRRLRLLPKFTVVALIVMAPMVLVTTLLIQELNKSIAFAQQERNGVQLIREIEELIHLSQLHRGLRHMALAGNKDVPAPATTQQAAIDKKFETILAGQALAAIPGTHAALTTIGQDWRVLQGRQATLKPRELYAAHGALIDRLYKLNAHVADRSNLTLDPRVETHYLIGAFVKSFPELAEGLAEIAGRGAAYIDTGLLEANEDVLLSSTVMLAQRDLARIPAQLDAMYRENPAFKSRLEAQAGALPGALAFLERARAQVLNASNDVTGIQFFEAGSKAIGGLHGFALASADQLDAALASRIDQFQQRRNLMAGGVLIALLAAAYLLAGFYLSFRSEVRELETAVGLAASGDLSARVSSPGKDEIAQLLNAFGGMSAGLVQLVSEVRSGTETIALASHEIARGNADLSTRTEEQANSLYATAASMEQFARSAKQNVEGAQQANRLALAASDVAVRGGAAVAQAVHTMGSMTASARKITEIISVIDGIAFQTNILALNAAVEAARAGAQGKGFAVVASEVRNLAQRSAAAAKEIKILITESVETAATGSAQVQRAGDTMNEIVGAIRMVTDVMGDITIASAAQRSEIEQVNQTLVQMDEITQQNAALVEEAAAAADSMHGQAVMLAQAVAVFRLGDQSAQEGVATEAVAASAAALAAKVHSLPAQRVAANADLKRTAQAPYVRLPRVAGARLAMR